MDDALKEFADAASLTAHLDERFANGDIERALGGFGLMLVQPVGALGDVALYKQVAQTMSTTLRDTDFLAVLDPSTFAVVLPQISDRATAALVAQKLSDAMQRTSPRVSATIVVSLFPADGGTRDALVAHALKLLYADQVSAN